MFFLGSVLFTFELGPDRKGTREEVKEEERKSRNVFTRIEIRSHYFLWRLAIGKYILGKNLTTGREEGRLPHRKKKRVGRETMS